MARPLRIEYPGACYHVLNRGNQHQAVFRDVRGHTMFLEKLEQFASTFEVEVRSYCLMPNHFHLYVRTPQANLSRFMQSLLTSYTLAANKRHRRSGHLFQGRFKAFLIEEEAYGSRLSRYIHLNPIRTRGAAERAPEELKQELRAFRWSSYAETIGLRRPPDWLDTRPVLRTWGRGKRQQQRGYAEYVESGLLKGVDDALEAEAIHGILGTDSFIDRMRRLAAHMGVSDRRECLEAARLQASTSLEQVIAAVCKAYGVDRAAVLRRYNRGCEARQVLLYLATERCRRESTLSDLAGRLGPVSLGTLSKCRHQTRKRLDTDTAFAQRLEKVKAVLTHAPAR